MRHSPNAHCACGRCAEIIRRNGELYSAPGLRTAHLCGLDVQRPEIQLALVLYHLPESARPLA